MSIHPEASPKDKLREAAQAALDLLQSSLVVEGYLVVRGDINEVKEKLMEAIG